MGDCRKTNRGQNKITSVAQLNEGYKFKMDLTTNGANSSIGLLSWSYFPTHTTTPWDASSNIASDISNGNRQGRGERYQTPIGS
ncbi:MAG: hypothetical protein ACR2IS_13110 [Nitrososphaeraceae archaeon]